MRVRILNTTLFICILLFLSLEVLFVASAITGKEDVKNAPVESRDMHTAPASERSMYTVNIDRDPFNIPAKYSAARANTPAPVFEYSLKAISGVEGKYTAIFKNNKSGMSVSVTSGDIIGGWKVKSISGEKIALENKGFRKELSVW